VCNALERIRKDSWTNLKYDTGICLEGREIGTKNLSEDLRDLKRHLPDKKQECWFLDHDVLLSSPLLFTLFPTHIEDSFTDLIYTYKH
jgi:hypothetical protein